MNEATVCIAHGAFVPCRRDGQHRTTSNPYWVKAVRDYQGSSVEGLTWEPAWEHSTPTEREGGDVAWLDALARALCNADGKVSWTRDIPERYRRQAAILAPLIAERERAARAEAEADRDHWKAHAEEAGEGFSRVCKDYARVSARNSELVRRVEAAEAKVARVEALADEAGDLDNGILVWDLRAALSPETREDQP